MSRVSSRRQRLAMVSPWPPQASGVADYAASLAGSLAQHYDVDAYHDPATRPDLGTTATEIPGPFFGRLRPFRPPHNVLYQMGNSLAHAFLYPILLTHPGVVTLHDVRLTHFH